MPAVSPRGRGRRAMNEINMVPFIDVMLVLLIIFMVTAPLITTGVVDLPSVGRAKQAETRVIEVIVGADETAAPAHRGDETDKDTPTTLQTPGRAGARAPGRQCAGAGRHQRRPQRQVRRRGAA